MPYNKNNLQFARDLRRELTPWERKLWFRFLKDVKPRFKRQKPIYGFIADFYCAERKLIIELDGSQHYEDVNTFYDASRTEYLEKKGYKVLRYSNYYIDKNFDVVCESILREIGLMW